MDILRRLKRHWKVFALIMGMFLVGIVSLGLILSGKLPLSVVSLTKNKSKVKEAQFISLENDGLKIGTNTIRISRNRMDMGALKIKNLADPTENQDAATKKYVDDSVRRTIVGRRTDNGLWDSLGTFNCQGNLREGLGLKSDIVWDKAGNNWWIDGNGGVFKNGALLYWGAVTINTPKIGTTRIYASETLMRKYCRYCQANRHLISWSKSSDTSVTCRDIASNCTCSQSSPVGANYVTQVRCAHGYDGLKW